MPDTINPNDKVRVRLTDAGKRMLVEDVDRANDDLRSSPKCLFRVKVPEWDSDGWCINQFHFFLSALGHGFGLGREMPFTEMEKLP